MLFCHAFILTLVAKIHHKKTSLELMKVLKNQQLQLKLINKKFVKKTGADIDNTPNINYFWIWHYMCN